MTEFSLVASFELYFLLRFSVSVSVCGLGGSTGFDFLNPLPIFDYSIFLFWAWTDGSGIISSVLMQWCIAMRPQLHGAVMNFLHGCSLK